MLVCRNVTCRHIYRDAGATYATARWPRLHCHCFLLVTRTHSISPYYMHACLLPAWVRRKEGKEKRGRKRRKEEGGRQAGQMNAHVLASRLYQQLPLPLQALPTQRGFNNLHTPLRLSTRLYQSPLLAHLSLPPSTITVRLQARLIYSYARVNCAQRHRLRGSPDVVWFLAHNWRLSVVSGSGVWAHAAKNIHAFGYFCSTTATYSRCKTLH